MSSFSDGAFEIRSNDPQAEIALCRTLGVIPTVADVSFSRWKDGVLMGVVMYQRYTHTAIMLHAVSYEPNWLTRDFLWLVFHYPFNQLGCERVFSTVDSSNTGALAFNEKVGFRIETRVGKVYPTGDQVILVMERADCRWLKLKPKGIKSNKEYYG